jgi:hypothetical protein
VPCLWPILDLPRFRGRFTRKAPVRCSVSRRIRRSLSPWVGGASARPRSSMGLAITHCSPGWTTPGPSPARVPRPRRTQTVGGQSFAGEGRWLASCYWPRPSLRSSHRRDSCRSNWLQVADVDSEIALSLGGCRNLSSSRPDLDDRRRVVAEYVSRTQRAERPRPGPTPSADAFLGASSSGGTTAGTGRASRRARSQ